VEPSGERERLPAGLRRRALAALAFSLAASGCDLAEEEGPAVTVLVETVENRVDGSVLRGCRTRLVPGVEGRAGVTLTLGIPRPAAEHERRARATPSHCSASRTRSLGDGTPGHPKLEVALRLLPPAPTEGAGLETRAQIRIRRHTGFDEDGGGRYATTESERSLALDPAGELAVPIWIADASEREAYGVREVFLHLSADALAPAPAGYGTLRVFSDVAGARLWLDGGEVSRSTGPRPVEFENVLAGRREIAAWDLSGREARATVSLRAGATTEVHLDILGLGADPSRPLELIPIGANPQGYQEAWRPRDGAIMVEVPAGEFSMGSMEGEGEPDERPQRRVHVSRFWIDKTEVTWQQFRRYADATGSPLPPAPLWGSPDLHPVSYVRWSEASAYCEWVGGRLPTEAEWEKGARGGDGRRYPWGERWTAGRCNSWDGGPHKARPIGSYPDCVSPYGVLDMAGNIEEWCADWYGPYPGTPAGPTPPRDPRGPEQGRMRVLRGGGWLDQPLFLRAARRYRNNPNDRKVRNGFRCVRSGSE
jgi:formylglycine-generating enzyme required for sulfatase activity